MSNGKDETVQLLKALQLGETLSGLVAEYPADLNEILKELDSMLGELPEQWRPGALVKFRAYLEAKKSEAAQRATTIAGDGQAYWKDLIGSVTALQREVPTVLQEIALPPSLRPLKLTYQARVYQAIARGNNTVSGLEKEFPEYTIRGILRQLRLKGLVKSVRRGVLRINEPSTASREVVLTSSVQVGTHQADVYNAISGGTTSARGLREAFPGYSIHEILFQLKKRNLIESTGRGEYRIKVQHTAPLDVPTRHTGQDIGSFMTPAEAATKIKEYLMQHPKEDVDYGILRSLASGISVRQFNNVMTRIKRLPKFSGSKGKIEYTGEYKQPDKVGVPRVAREGSTSITARVRSYVEGMKAEQTLGEMATHFPSVKIKTLERILYTLAGEGVIEYKGMIARKKGMPPEAAPDAAQYVGEMSIPNGAAGSPPPATHATTLAEVPVDYSAQISSCYGVLPDLDIELSQFETVVEKIPEALRERIYKFVLESVLPKNKEAVTAEHATALQPLTEAFRTCSDTEQLIGYLESKDRIEPKDMERYLNEFTSAITQPPESADIRAPTRPVTEKSGLSSYAGVSEGMRVVIGRLRSTIAANPGEVGDRIEKYVLGILPTDTTNVSDTQFKAVSAISSALKQLANYGKSVEPLLRRLESQEMDPAKVPGYLREFLGEQPEPVVAITTTGGNQFDLSDKSYWTDVFSHGKPGEMLGKSVPYIVGRNGQFEHALQNFLGDNYANPSCAWKPYALQQIVYFMQKAEQELGSIPPEVYSGFLHLLKPDGQTHLQRVYRMVGQKGKLSTQQGVELLKEISGKGDNAIVRILGKYSGH